MTTSTLASFVTPELKAKLATGKITLAELTKFLARSEEVVVSAKVPLPVAITPKQKEALERLELLFGIIAPEEVRELTQFEQDCLMDERLTIDEIADMIESRKADIRTIVLNHIDAENAQDTEYPRDKNGHILKAAKLPPSSGQTFSWEVANRGGTLDVTALKALDEVGEIDHDDYLAMTDQVRVVNEAKVMELLKKKPELINKLGAAVTKKSQVGSLYVRKAKNG